LLFCLFFAFSLAQSSGYTCETRHNGTFCLTWYFTDANTVAIIGDFKYNGTGWISIAFNPNSGKMIPVPDTIVAWVNYSSQTLVYSCRNMIGYTPLTVPEVPCYHTILNGVTKNNGTNIVFGFTRPLVPNSMYATPFMNNYIAVIWGIGPYDNVQTVNSNLTYHGQNNKGSFAVNFLTGAVLPKFPAASSSTIATLSALTSTNGLSPGAQAGIAIGVIVGVLLIVLLITPIIYARYKGDDLLRLTQRFGSRFTFSTAK